MNKDMIAARPMTYATRRLVAGDAFTAPRRDADLLQRLGRASEAAAVGREAKNDAVLTKLRDQYQVKFGKKAFHGWDAAALTEKLSED